MLFNPFELWTFIYDFAFMTGERAPVLKLVFANKSNCALVTFFNFSVYIFFRDMKKRQIYHTSIRKIDSDAYHLRLYVWGDALI